MPEVVYTRDLSSGRVHQRYRTPGGNLASLEADNLDDAGDYVVITADEAAAAPAEMRCERCFPAAPEPEA